MRLALWADDSSVTLAVAHSGFAAYVILYLAVAASWIGVPIVGAGVLAAAGVLASEGELNIWIVIAVATAASWTGGYVGYLLGAHAGGVLVHRPGPWWRERQRASAAGERIYRRWGRLAVFVTPTWVSGVLRMPRNTFLVWNAFAAVASTCIAALGAYGVGAAVIGQLRSRRGILALAVAGLALAAVAIVLQRRRRALDADRTPPERAPRSASR
jgi:membrane protein DedA with SNARE-associated domain